MKRITTVLLTIMVVLVFASCGKSDDVKKEENNTTTQSTVKSEEKTTKDTAVTTTGDTSEAATEAATEETSEAATEATTEETSEAVTEATTEETSEAATEATTEETSEAVTEAATEPAYTPLESGSWYSVTPDPDCDDYLLDVISFANSGYDFGTARKVEGEEPDGYDIITYGGAKYYITDCGGEGYAIEYKDNGDTIEMVISQSCNMTLTRVSDNQLTITKVDEGSGFEIGKVYER